MTTFERIQQVISEDLGVDESEIHLDTSFVDICTDSLEMANLVLCLECEFSIEFPPEEIAKMLVIQDAVNYADRNN